MNASGLWSFAYSINFQIRQIPATNHHFSCEKKPNIVWVKISEKKTPFFQVWDIVTTGKQIEKNLFCHWKNTSKLSRTWSLALPIHNFLSHLHFFKVSEIMLKYGDSILPAEHILDLYCLWLSNAAPFAKII